MRTEIAGNRKDVAVRGKFMLLRQRHQGWRVREEGDDARDDDEIDARAKKKLDGSSGQVVLPGMP